MDINTKSESPTSALLERIKELQNWKSQQLINHDARSITPNISDLRNISPSPTSEIDYEEYNSSSDKTIVGQNFIEEDGESSSPRNCDEREFSFVKLHHSPSEKHGPLEFTNHVDALPVKGIPVKRFDEYIDEEIKNDQHVNTNVINNPNNKRKFLRRGEGLQHIKKYARIKLKPKSTIDKRNAGKQTRATGRASSSENESLPQKPLNKQVARLNNQVNKQSCGGEKMKRIPLKKLSLVQASAMQASAIQSEEASRPISRSSSGSQEISENGITELEDQELSAFEHLEELADNTSFSSNSSTVKRFLEKSLKSKTNTKCRTNLLSMFEDGEDSPSSESEIASLVFHARSLIQNEEGCDVSYTDDEIYTAIQNAIANSKSEMVMSSQFNNLHEIQASTPNMQKRTSQLENVRPKVHFNQAEVLEFEASEFEETLTEAPSLEEESDIVSLNDLEDVMQISDVVNKGQEDNDEVNPQITVFSSDLNGETSTDVSKQPSLNVEGNPVAPLLIYSPPKIPQDAASHLIWSLYSKDRKTIQKKPKLIQSEIKNTNPVPQNIIKQPEVHLNPENDDLESCKILLLAKLKQLDGEINIYQETTAKVQYMEKMLLEEKQKLERQEAEFMRQKAEETRKLQMTIESERTKLWKECHEERKNLISKMEAKIITQENKDLKESISDLKEQLIKKDSLNQHKIKKLNEKIKKLEVENRNFKTKILSLQSLEKENINLKHQLDRTKLQSKSKPPLANKKIENNLPKPSEETNFEDRTKKIKSPDLSHSTNVSIIEVYPSKSIDFQKHSKTLDLLTSPEYTKRLENINNALQPSEGVILSDTSVLGSASPFIDTVIPKTHKPQFNDTISTTKSLSSDCTEVQRPDGTKEITYSNGNRKETYSDDSYIMYYYNGDTKEVYPDKTRYVYGNDKTVHSIYPDGKQVLEFPNGQIETIHPDKSSEIRFPDDSTKYLSTNGSEVCVFPDGTISSTSVDGTKVIEYSNGQKEVHKSNGSKERIYPDGTIKIMHLDGRLETRYKNGSVRIKDKVGNVITS